MIVTIDVKDKVMYNTAGIRQVFTISCKKGCQGLFIFDYRGRDAQKGKAKNIVN